MLPQPPEDGWPVQVPPPPSAGTHVGGGKSAHGQAGPEGMHPCAWSRIEMAFNWVGSWTYNPQEHTESDMADCWHWLAAPGSQASAAGSALW
jgi:hypothetical protein